VADELQPAHAAVERGDWDRALELLDRLGDAGRTPAALELRATAAYGAGQLEACVTAWEEHHLVSLRAGDELGAARPLR
jgi:hypothetical protein